MAKIGLPKGFGKLFKVREKSVKSQGILKWILSGPVNVALDIGFSTRGISTMWLRVTTNSQISL